MICCCWWFATIESGHSISPGCGCDRKAVETIASELQERKIKRGNFEQIRLHEELSVKMDDLTLMVDAILNKRNVGQSGPRALPPRPITSNGRLQYDVTYLPGDCCSGWCAAAGCCKTMLYLEEEEVRRAAQP